MKKIMQGLWATVLFFSLFLIAGLENPYSILLYFLVWLALMFITFWKLGLVREEGE